MAVQVLGLWSPNTAVRFHYHEIQTRRNSFQLSPTAALATTASLSSPPPSIQIVSSDNPSWYGNGSANLKSHRYYDDCEGEPDWDALDADLYYWTKPLRPVQWYPGHIAKTEKELKEQLKLMDVVIEVRDARIPLSTGHPQMDAWLGNRKRILVLNREDMISKADRNAWASYYARQGVKVILSNGKLGMGTLKLGRLAKALAENVNVKRRAKGLLPRAVRAGIVGYPNVGKSSLINRLLKRRMCPAAPRPGVTRELKWVRFGKGLELLDSPGMLPMRINDQSAAIKLAICDDIGERSYDVADVAAILVQMLTRLPAVGDTVLQKRYKIDVDGHCGKTYVFLWSITISRVSNLQHGYIPSFLPWEKAGEVYFKRGETISFGIVDDHKNHVSRISFVEKVAINLFNGDNNQAAFRILSDFRKGKFGWVALERPPG